MDELIDKTVPRHIRSEGLKIAGPQSESEALADFEKMMSANQVMRSHIGQGYYDTLTPTVILRNILENPAWYTPYTPYQVLTFALYPCINQHF